MLIVYVKSKVDTLYIGANIIKLAIKYLKNLKENKLTLAIKRRQ